VLTRRDPLRSSSVVYRILYRFFATLARLAVRSGRSKDFEFIVLRHQLIVLRRQDHRPELNHDDRTVLGAIAQALPRPRRAGWLATLWVPEIPSWWSDQGFRVRVWHPQAIVGHRHAASAEIAIVSGFG
jgi:hypothetical protein